MQFAIEKWEAMITRMIEPEALKKISQAGLANLIEGSLKIKEELRTQLSSQVLSAADAKSIELYIQHHQAVLTGLLDKLHAASEALPSRLITKLCDEVSNQLEEILQLIEHYFKSYFNLDEKVPAAYLKRAKAELKLQVADLKKEFKKRAEIDEQLVTITFSALNAFVNGDHAAYTYRGMMYYRELLTELGRIGNLRRQDCACAVLKELLIYMNFNTPGFTNYFLTEINQTLQDLPLDRRIEKLAGHKKEIGLMPVKPNVALLPENRSAQEMLVNTITKEIEYYREIRPQSVLSELAGTAVKEQVHVLFKGLS